MTWIFLNTSTIKIKYISLAKRTYPFYFFFPLVKDLVETCPILKISEENVFIANLILKLMIQFNNR